MDPDSLDRAREQHRLGVAAGDDGHLADAAELFRQALLCLGLDRQGNVLEADSVSPATDADSSTTTLTAARAQTTTSLKTAAPAQTTTTTKSINRVRDQVAARILMSMALPAYELGQVQSGLDTIEAAEKVAARARFTDIRVLLQGQRGLLLMRAGRPHEAISDLDQAVRLIRYAEPIESCKIWMNRGDAHHLLGHVAAARADFSQAVDVARAHGLAEFEFRNIHNAAFMEYLAGDLPKALQMMPTPASASSDYARGVVGMDRSKVLLSAGLVTEADEILQQACAALERTDLTQLLAEAELARAETALLADHPGLAGELSRRAAGRFRRRHNRRWTTLAELVILEADVAAGTTNAPLARKADRLATRLDEHGLPDKARRARLIATELELGRPRRRRCVQRPEVRRGEPIDLRLHVRLVRAQVAFAAGDVTRGRREVRTGLDELSSYQSGFGSFDLQTSSAAHGVGLAALGVGEAIAANRPTAVLQFLERARAISSRVPSVLPPDDESTAQLLSQLRWVASTLEETEAHGRPDVGMRRRRTLLEREIQARSWTTQGPRRVDRVVTTGRLRQALSGGTLVALFVLHRQVHGVVLTEAGCSMRGLAELDQVEELTRRINADLDALAMDGFPEPLRLSVRRSFSRSVEALDKLLLAPLAVPEGPVVILPPARLAGLPWGQLPTFRGRPTTVAPSASTWLAARLKLRPGQGRVVAIAGPGLARAEDEVARVASSWDDCTTLTGAEATGSALLEAMDGAKLVHIAAHGQHQRDSPLFSSIKLADGPVVGYDLDRVRHPPEHAVLSACDLGQATARPGDEALGLARALLHSGTSTVVAGVAKVSDHGAAELMADYHWRLSRGATAAAALADALSAAPDPIPFVCFGAGW